MAGGRNVRLDARRGGPAPELTPWLNLAPRSDAAAPSDKEMSEHHERNELGDAELFQRLHGEDFCFDHGRKLWMAYTGVIWEQDVLCGAHRAVVKLGDLYEETGRRG